MDISIAVYGDLTAGAVT